MNQTMFPWKKSLPELKPQHLKDGFLVSNIINENQLQTLLASSITHITTEGTNGNYAIPEVLTDNGDLVIFTKTDELGWHLNKGEQLTIQFPLDLKTRSKYSDQTEKGWRSAILKTVR